VTLTWAKVIPSSRHPVIPSSPRPALGLLDAISLVVGIIIGSGIYRTPADVFANVPDAADGLLVWLAGGAVALVGALCYAELATAYPSSSGEYLYLRRAYGPFVGFAFAWAMLTVIRTGASLAPVAYVFALYAQQLHDLGPHSKLIYVTAAIGVLSLVNALGIHPGRRTQNLLTLAKLLGLGGLVLAGLWLAVRPTPVLLIEQPAAPPAHASLTLALVMVLWTYSGWHETAYVVADLRDRSRNISRALLLGVAAVTAVYLAVNVALLAGLGLAGVRESKAVASDLLEKALGPPGKVAMAWLVVISALGATNGLTLAGGRFFAGFGDLHPGFGWLGAGRTRRGAPLVALAAQAAVSLGMVALVECGDAWRAWIAGAARSLGVKVPLDLTAPTDGFETLVVSTGPVFWFFFLLTGVGLLVLRVREPDQPRPFRVPLFPLVPVLFCAVCVFMLYQSGAYAVSRRPAEALVVAGLLLLGVPVYALTRRPKEADDVAPTERP
jgi:basic amino acid/polyamine antiporter, APA family